MNSPGNQISKMFVLATLSLSCGCQKQVAREPFQTGSQINDIGVPAGQQKYLQVVGADEITKQDLKKWGVFWSEANTRHAQQIGTFPPEGQERWRENISMTSQLVWYTGDVVNAASSFLGVRDVETRTLQAGVIIDPHAQWGTKCLYVHYLSTAPWNVFREVQMGGRPAKGAGTAALALAADWSRKNGFPCLDLDSIPSSLPFYEKIGMVHAPMANYPNRMRFEGPGRDEFIARNAAFF